MLLVTSDVAPPGGGRTGTDTRQIPVPPSLQQPSSHSQRQVSGIPGGWQLRQRQPRQRPEVRRRRALWPMCGTGARAGLKAGTRRSDVMKQTTVADVMTRKVVAVRAGAG